MGRLGDVTRPLRIQYDGALYHVLSRGDRREAIFLDDTDRREFLRSVGEACLKMGWQVHAYCLSNHFHLVLETPQANLALGMKWLLGTYTQRFNRRHHHWGHLFGGRYKAQLVDGRGQGYLRTVCDYVHLNPVRAGMVAPDDALESYPWSSYPAYRTARLRPLWLRIDRLFGEHGLEENTAVTRREFERRMGLARLVLRQPSPDELTSRCRFDWAEAPSSRPRAVGSIWLARHENV